MRQWERKRKLGMTVNNLVRLLGMGELRKIKRMKNSKKIKEVVSKVVRGCLQATMDQTIVREENIMLMLSQILSLTRFIKRRRSKESSMSLLKTWPSMKLLKKIRLVKIKIKLRLKTLKRYQKLKLDMKMIEINWAHYLLINSKRYKQF